MPKYEPPNSGRPNRQAPHTLRDCHARCAGDCGSGGDHTIDGRSAPLVWIAKPVATRPGCHAECALLPSDSKPPLLLGLGLTGLALIATGYLIAFSILVRPPAPGEPLPELKTDSPAQAAAAIHRTVARGYPVLLPKEFPERVLARYRAWGEGFDVEYVWTSGERRVILATIVPIAPPAHGQSSTRAFRGTTAAYHVIDNMEPSKRMLTWNEAPPAKVPGSKTMPYYLAADGLTDEEFWHLAASLE